MTTEHRNTKQRAAVRSIMSTLGGFRTAQDVHDDLKRMGENIGLATVYRTLQAMGESGELDVVRTPEGVAAYRSCQAGHHHHHLICRACGKAVEVEFSELEPVLDKLAGENGFRELDHEIELFGLCPDC
jgi:Fur family ferric uptake transcriptional regulator